MLIILGGLPGTGKTMIAKELACQIGAVYLRIDSIEQAMRDSGAVSQPLNDTGYRVAYVILDNLRLGRTVIADSVNPIRLTRDAWLGVAHHAQVGAAEVEVICSEQQQHRQRVETRPADVSGLRVPTREEVVSREYEPWEDKHIIIDTTGRSVAESVEERRRTSRSSTEVTDLALALFSRTVQTDTCSWARAAGSWFCRVTRGWIAYRFENVPRSPENSDSLRV